MIPKAVLNEEPANVSANNMEVNTDSDLGLMKTLMKPQRTPPKELVKKYLKVWTNISK